MKNRSIPNTSNLKGKASVPLPKIIIYGAGGLFQALLPPLQSTFEIIGLLDSDPEKFDCIINGYTVFSPEQLASHKYDYIVITSMYEEPIRERLRLFGVDSDKVIVPGQQPEFLTNLEKYLRSEGALRKLPHSAVQKPIIRITINSLGGGGAEKSLISLLPHIQNLGYEIDLILFQGNGIYLDHLPKGITHYFVFEPGPQTLRGKVWLKNVSAEYAFHQLFDNQVDVEIAFLEGWATKLVAASPCKHKIAWIHTNLKTNPWTRQCYRSLEEERFCFSQFDYRVFVSNNALSGFIDSFGNLSKTNRIIENIIESGTLKASHAEAFRLVSVGRLEKVKGFERLIKAHAELLKSYPELELLLLGEGSQKDVLMQLTESLGSETKTHFGGFHPSPFEFFSTKDIFVNCSFTEGHPLAVGEAMTRGMAIIATECDGNREILGNGKYGLLVTNNVKGLTSSIANLLEQPGLVDEFAQRAKLGGQHFSTSEIMKKIIAVLPDFTSDIRKNL